MLNQAKDLFIVQTDLIDAKIEVSVSNANKQLIELIMNLRMEMHQGMGALRQEISDLRHEMIDRFSEIEKRFSKVESRLSAVETALGMRNQVRGEIRTRFFDYTFRAGWTIGLVVLSAAVSSLMFMLHSTL